MGYASREELLTALNELLEAERAGARVTSETAAQIAQPELKHLVADIRHDEAHWCLVLTKAIQSLDAQPTGRIGAFYDKAIAIADLPQRLAFLNRGQGWVVRKLQALLPTIESAALRHDLDAMLVSHEANIERVQKRLEAPSDDGTPRAAS